MRKIKNITQLHAEKLHLESRQEILEARILGNWQDLKQSVTPGNLAKGTFNQVLSIAMSGDILRGALTYGAGLLVKRIAGKSGSKLAGLFKK
jgi:hypothetical protein